MQVVFSYENNETSYPQCYVVPCNDIYVVPFRTISRLSTSFSDFGSLCCYLKVRSHFLLLLEKKFSLCVSWFEHLRHWAVTWWQDRILLMTGGHGTRSRNRKLMQLPVWIKMAEQDPPPAKKKRGLYMQYRYNKSKPISRQTIHNRRAAAVRRQQEEQTAGQSPNTQNANESFCDQTQGSMMTDYDHGTKSDTSAVATSVIYTPENEGMPCFNAFFSHGAPRIINSLRLHTWIYTVVTLLAIYNIFMRTFYTFDVCSNRQLHWRQSTKFGFGRTWAVFWWLVLFFKRRWLRVVLRRRQFRWRDDRCTTISSRCKRRRRKVIKHANKG